MNRFFSLLLALLACPAAANAGAWTEGQNDWLVINTLSYYRVTVSGYNPFGKPTGTGTYSQAEFSPYLEYGLTDRWTVGAQPRFQTITQSGLPGTGHSTGLVQLNLFGRYQVYRDDLNAFSVQAQLGIPGAATTENPQLAQPNAEYEGRLLYGRNLILPEGWTGFTDAEAAYRVEEDGYADQFRGDFTLGLSPVPHWTLLAQSFNTVSLGNVRPAQPHYDLYRVEFSALHDLSAHAAVQLGFWHDAGGENIALGNAGIVALWLRY